jgi:hypothetical protein
VAAVQMPATTTFWTRKYKKFASLGASRDMTQNANGECSHARYMHWASYQDRACLSSDRTNNGIDCSINLTGVVSNRQKLAASWSYLSRRSVSSKGDSQEASGSSGASKQRESPTTASTASVSDDVDEDDDEDDDDVEYEVEQEYAFHKTDDNVEHITVSPDDGTSCNRLLFSSRF